MRIAVVALLALAAAAPALAARNGGERFSPVMIVGGQGVRANVSNLQAPFPTATVALIPCPVDVGFFSGDGGQIGSTQTIELAPGASMSVPAVSPPPGLVRAEVSIADTTKAQFCALKADLEVFDAASGATRFAVPSEACLGLGRCATPLPGGGQ